MSESYCDHKTLTNQSSPDAYNYFIQNILCLYVSTFEENA